jgi:hypothetical protein
LAVSPEEWALYLGQRLCGLKLPGSGPVGMSFVVDTSTNLHDWLPLSTSRFGIGLFKFVDPESTTLPLRF